MTKSILNIMAWIVGIFSLVEIFYTAFNPGTYGVLVVVFFVLNTIVAYGAINQPTK